VSATIDALVEERRLARERGDFKRADEIRAELRTMGFYVQDRKDGTRINDRPGYHEEMRAWRRRKPCATKEAMGA